MPRGREVEQDRYLARRHGFRDEQFHLSGPGKAGIAAPCRQPSQKVFVAGDDSLGINGSYRISPTLPSQPMGGKARGQFHFLALGHELARIKAFFQLQHGTQFSSYVSPRSVDAQVTRRIWSCRRLRARRSDWISA